MEQDDWMGGGNDGERERDNYSYEDSEQFDEDDIYSMGTDEGGSRRDDWDGWEGEGERGNEIPFPPPLDDFPSTSGLGTLPPLNVIESSINVDSPRGGSFRRESARAASAASVLTLTPSIGRGVGKPIQSDPSPSFPSLKSIAVKACARHLTFYALEDSYNHARLHRYTQREGKDGVRMGNLTQINKVSQSIPHDILLSILECSFPDGDDDIRLYCCLANGSVDEFNRGDSLYKSGSVENVMQIGFLLTADVYPCCMTSSHSPLNYYGDDVLGARRDRRTKMENGIMKSVARRESNAVPYKVSLGIDRCRVVSCECECAAVGWCHHMVAVCLYRIHQKKEVEYRGTMWDSINELDILKCRKLSQWLVNELPRKFIPVAQRLLDGLKDKQSVIYQSQGAPDPTDGGHEAISRWFMSRELNDKVANVLYKFCQPSPTVHCDVQFLSSTPPAIYSEWQLLLQPLKSKKPEGIWNLLSIARALLKKRDANSTSLLHVITDQVLASTHMLLWWLVTSLQQSGQWTHSSDRKNNPLMTNYEVPQLCGAALCEEIVDLWRIAALNPAMKPYEKRKLASIIQHYHTTAVERLCKVIDSMGVRGGKGMETHSNIFSLLISSTVNEHRVSLSTATLKFTLECFPGFYPALQACHFCWSPSELLSLPPDATFSLDSSVSPHLPQSHGALRRPYTVASTCPQNSSLLFGFGMVENGGNAKKKKKSKKKKGSSSKKSTRQRIVEALEQFDLDELESAESGQESDMPGPSSGVKIRSSSYPYDDLDALFAAAHSPLEGISLKMARCEALFSHGHTTVAAARAAELVVRMRGSLPAMVWTYDRMTGGVADSRSAVSNSIPITFTKDFSRRRVDPTEFHSPTHNFNTAPHHSFVGGPTPFVRKKYGRGGAANDVVLFPVSSMLPPLQLPDAEVHNIAKNTCRTLERAITLAKQLSSYPSHRHSVFRLLVDVLERPKGAMSTNHLQVKLFHLESEIISILNTMILDGEELKVIREKASLLARLDLYPTTKGDDGERGERGVPPVSLALFIFNSLVIRDNILLKEEDEDLGVGASLFVLGSSHSYPEASFPMLGECVRRQRGDLALRLLKRYKDNSVKLGLILDRLLDSSQHRMYKYKSNGVYFLARDPILGPVIERGERPTMVGTMGYLLKKKEKMEREEGKKSEKEEKGEEMIEEREEGSSSRRPSLQQSVGSWESGGMGGNGEERSSIDDSEESGGGGGGGGGGEDRSSISTRRSSDEGNDSSSNSLSHSGSHFPSSGRTMVGMNRQRQSIGSINHQGGSRINKKTRMSFACEAHSHYMVELAKRILVEAGGDHSSSVFIHAPSHNGPHRKLLMCSFLTGLYALGLSNKASSTWASRTYSTHSGCLTQQALEIGSAALFVMTETWTLHFTPSEAASLADKAGRLSDRSSVELGARLALSVLSHSHALSCPEGIRALDQCKEQGYQFLEKAITAVEEANIRDEVFPEILFRASHLWADTVSMDDAHSQPFLLPFHTLVPFNGGISSLAPNPFYHHAAVLQQQQQAAAAQLGGSAPPLPPSQIQYGGVGGVGQVPPMGRGEGHGTSENPSSSGLCGGVNTCVNRPVMHLSHSAPNLNGVAGTPPSLHPPLPPPTNLPTKYDPRLERLARAQRIGLKAMECMAKRGGEEDKKYSKDPPNSQDLVWLFKLSQWMGTHYVLLFCEMCCKTVCSPHLLAQFVIELLKTFPNMHHGSMRLAATAYRPPQGMGQGKFRGAALSVGWQPPTADVFDRAMESAYEAIANRLKPNIQRLTNAETEEILEVLNRIRTILQPNWIPTGWPLFEELASHCLKHKAVKSHKELQSNIKSLIYGPPGVHQYPFQG